jgi:phosphoglycolate phosphatase (TIGR01487 family)
MLLIVVDYDGTLAEENHPVKREVAQSVMTLKQKHGFKLILATARPLSDIERFVKVTLFDALILELGSVLFFPPSDLILFRPKWWNTFIEEVSRVVPRVNLGEVLYYFDQDNISLAQHVLLNKQSEYSVEMKKVGSRTHVFAPRGLDKGVGVSRLLQVTGWDAKNMVAIGDSASDIPMFRIARFKVAVANADQKLKEMADYVTNRPYGEGVVEGLQKILGEPK